MTQSWAPLYRLPKRPAESPQIHNRQLVLSENRAPSLWCSIGREIGSILQGTRPKTPVRQ
jgi:hypothetical protein